MHRGHLDAIMKAKKQNDKVLLIVCGYNDEERALSLSLSLKERTNRVKRLFKKDEQIIVRSINDTELGIDESMSESNWDIWLHKVNSYINELQINCYDKITFYVAEPNYKKSIDKLTTNNKLGALSGGEKALTALALVFSIQKYLPAPFYALDEVDASLDTMNVERIAEMIKKQSENTQFLVVSHRRPMIEAAVRTIGVTQKEKGKTKVTGVTQ